ncbi:flavodoxin reductase [Aeromonas media]|uniref:Ferric reductase-like transmembrane domain-containing protein n=2 Tax=Aeromonas media TaxID=651 RepID=A0AAE6SHF8_AERME|nr:ferric reductase-like transmembrane domain-containing protein [Aeromonas media]MBP8112809.1 ferric reductase-like transmembrane domain-containing protein [Aeromonas sp.]MBS4641957.1 ferric reductase-like transmembrane domain-containing protein [Aeromonas media]MCV3290687.1 ferric reductase-like transmembrane domain-containing protein [Aeromonas media]QHQ50142.1 flavodoxin reductase [Aeromonas media]QJT31932.1 flavodoxin reductase [Aeromonas media]
MNKEDIMKPASLAWALPLALTLIWLLGMTQWPAGLWPWRHELLILTGLLGLGAMTLSLLLALRLPRLEVWCGGLDRMLHLHRSSALWATGTLMAHWLLVEAPKWAVTADWLTRPARRGAGAGAGAGNDALWHELGNTLGEWGFYLLLALVVVSLLAVVHYERFKVVHRLAPVIYLMGWVHGLCLLPRIGVLTPVGLTLLVGGGLGAMGAIYSLFGRVGQNARRQGTVSTLTPLDERTLEIRVTLTSPLSGYRPGQFAFFDFAGRGEPHPYTLVNVSADCRTLTLAVRALGDHTHWLHQHLRVGDAVIVTGPYGAFALPDPAPALWVGAGIGITPFVAWLEALVRRGETRPGTTLLQCAPTAEAAPYHSRLAELCRRAGVDYRLHLESERGRLDLAALGERQHTPVWFCGPEPMAHTLDAHLTAPLHRELFRFR